MITLPPAAPGAGGAVRCWRARSDWARVEAAGGLPAARFRGEPFPDLVALAAGGAGRLLGCSSTGAVTLWDLERCAAAACVCRWAPGGRGATSPCFSCTMSHHSLQCIARPCTLSGSWSEA